jgi:transposase
MQWRQVLRGLRQGAVAAGFDTQRWTLPRIRHWVQQQFGVTYSTRYVGKKLHQLGWSPQQPAPVARERDAALVRAWLQHDWPAIKKSLSAQGPDRVCG